MVFDQRLHCTACSCWKQWCSTKGFFAFLYFQLAFCIWVWLRFLWIEINTVFICCFLNDVSGECWMDGYDFRCVRWHVWGDRKVNFLWSMSIVQVYGEFVNANKSELHKVYSWQFCKEVSLCVKTWFSVRVCFTVYFLLMYIHLNLVHFFTG